MIKFYSKAILPAGFKANAVSCGLKKSGKPDLAFFYSNVPAKASCVFTSNTLAAAPVILSRRFLKENKSGYYGIIVNSGNANCFTGKNGMQDALNMASYSAQNLGVDKESVLVASTGIIGKRLDIAKIKKALPNLIGGLSLRGMDFAKKAIMTTDTFAKEVTAVINIGKEKVAICAIAKGAGMIAPDMATMLCFIFTDADIKQKTLDKSLARAIEKSFNCISVDGCMSTNDSVMVLANGCSCRVDKNKRSLELFSQALDKVCLELAKMIVKDGEGATKFIQIDVTGASSGKEAKVAALAIANSALFKTAMYGCNPNFGRVVSAVGSCGIKVDEAKLQVKLSPLDQKNIKVSVDLGKGKAKSTVYTCDMTPAYVRINAEYN
ncbi:MAG: bifunctional glutamate N-acetyltransferase/amino-acid acetyltransferase ArgJ [Candidatus Omnitrophica bacterium]|jgi:glutamate N-acetyltransferase/amino-acid N-acetyltransferase|nr:bifunctional glutamate N-acetyltransferase/amino-acid acetyltransferase ArgJ [Candidatus Omnitrophota bacterium]